MQIDRADMGPVTVIRLEGDIDEDGVRELRTDLLNCVKAKRLNVVVNLTGIKFVSYMGVGVLVERLRQLRRIGGDMKLVGVNMYTERLFRMVGVSSVFDVFDTEAQAVQQFKQAA